MALKSRQSWLVSLLVPCLSIWLGSLVGIMGSLALPQGAQAAEELKVENLPKEPEAYKRQVDHIVDRVDSLIDKLGESRKDDPAVLKLIQSRDNVVEEAAKVVYHPEGARWTTEEARESTDAMLKVMKAQYEEAAELAG